MILFPEGVCVKDNREILSGKKTASIRIRGPAVKGNCASAYGKI
jgi:hypothetical protein